MPSGERSGGRPRPRARAGNVVVSLPRRGAGGRLDLAGLVPSGRSLLVAFGILVAGAGGWWVAKESSLFDVRRVDVVGAPGPVSRQVERTLSRQLGTSLLELDTERVRNRLLELPTVRAATLDRAFPSTLRVKVVPERPVAVLRQGADAWLVSARGRVVAEVERRGHRSLPRLWLPRTARVELGALVTGEPRTGIAAVAPLAAVGLATRVATVRVRSGELLLRLRSGLELRLGDPSDIRLKLAVGARVLPVVGGDAAYVDVSVPERPVAGTTLNSQVEIETSTSTIP